LVNLLAARDLISEHRLLSDSEARKVSKEFSTPLDKFPKIFESDPQAQMLEAKAGRLIAIDRRETDSRYTAYRYVVKG